MSPRDGRPVAVRHYLPGGRELGGGIGRLVGYLVDATAGDGEHHEVCDTRGASWTTASSLRVLAAARQIAADRVARPDCIQHIHVAGRGSTARKLLLSAAARSVGSRHYLHLHDYDYAGDILRRPTWQRRRIEEMFRKADGVIVLGGRDRSTVQDLLGVEATRIGILPNCVPDPGERSRPPTSDEPLILFLGTLGERKGVPELLRALSAPALRPLPWRAVLAGDGPLEHYRAMAAEAGLATRVTMPGWLPRQEVVDLCARADLLVLPSHGEGLAMAVLEGLAAGLPVVTTRVGAHEEVIQDGTSGVFVPPGDVDALAAALVALVQDPAERLRLATNARAQYLASFGMAAYRRKLRAFYGGPQGYPSPNVVEV